MNIADRLRRLCPDSVKPRLKRLLNMPTTRLHSDWEVLSLIGPNEKAHTVLDIGGHHGWFFHCWLDWCPSAMVHVFEPAIEAFTRMRQLYDKDPRIHMNQVGVGARRGQADLHVLEGSRVSNSFLEPSKAVWDAIEYRTGLIEHRMVPIVTVDEYCDEHRIDHIYLVKIDVQGFELEVLKGAKQMLPMIDYVFVEAGIKRLYHGAPSFAEVFLMMEQQGFHFMHMRAWHRGNRELVETDMLFRRDGLAPDIDRKKDRYYLELK